MPTTLSYWDSIGTARVLWKNIVSCFKFKRWVSCQLNLAILAGISRQGKEITKKYQNKSNPSGPYEFSLLLSCGTVYHAVQDGSPFKFVDEALVCDHSNKSY